MSPMKKRRGVYPKENLVKAVRDVEEGRMSSIEAADHYKVPSSTIRCHVNKYSSRVGAGPSFHLNPKQEEYLVEVIKSLGDIGVRVTKSILQKVSDEYIKLVSNNVRYTSKY
jgi:hypothetical protein